MSGKRDKLITCLVRMIHVKNYNILILSAGRRVELINCFKAAAIKLGIKSRIIAADMSETAPAIYFSDSHYLVPPVNDSLYIETIIEICKKEDISLIIPTIDPELLILSKNKKYVESTTNSVILVSDYAVVSCCRDKIQTQIFLKEKGFGVPEMVSDEQIKKNQVEFPVFIKPKSGSSSINAFQVNNMEELIFFKNYIEDPIIQELVTGEEYSVDVFLDFESKVISIVPRLRMAIRGGEISKGKIVKDREIIEDVKRLMTFLKPIGHITVQCIKTEKEIKYIEINPRFGGGAPMSIMAGADSCENLFRLLMNEKLSYHENYKENLIFLRFDESICLSEHMKIVNHSLKESLS